MASGSPLDAILQQALISQLAGGANPPIGGMAGPPSPEAGVASDVSRQATMLRQSDPSVLLKRITAVKQEVVAIINETGMSLPGVARSIAKVLNGLDQAAKEAGTAAATASVTDSMAPPINHSALGIPPQSMSGMGMGGM